MFTTCEVSLAEVATSLRDYAARVEFSPQRLAEIEERLALLEKLKRKYDSDLQGILKIRDELVEKLDGLVSLADHELALQTRLKAARNSYTEEASLLSACRRAAAPKLARNVMDELRHVALERATFFVSVETALEADDRAGRESGATESGLKGRADYFSPTGADRVEFFLSANPGEEPRTLSQTASGGELSRLMLVLRTVCARTGERGAEVGEAVIFDEIDAGIGGRVAEAVGKRLKALSKTRQVLCVTHQPQIARFADHHYVVEKRVQKGRTLTSIKELTPDERVGELARMIGGEEEAATTRETARWLLKDVAVDSRFHPRHKNSGKERDRTQE
jgi:DNA repair protein RecN (Recombination protein N)